MRRIDVAPQTDLNPRALYRTLLIAALLTGCTLAPPAQYNQLIAVDPQKILVVAIEAPPLEIIPDPIETRLPVERHYHNMMIDVPLRKTLFKAPGGLIVSGLTRDDDIVETVSTLHAHASDTLQSTQSLDGEWMPTLVIAENLVTRLALRNKAAELSPMYYRLPIRERTRNSYVNEWRAASMRWFEQERSSIDYRRASSRDTYDAVIEIGIGTYKIFEDQVALELLVKVFDPASGRLLAKTRTDSFSVSDTTENLLGHDGKKFKQAITDLGSALIDKALDNIGLRPGPARQAALPRLSER